MRVEGKCGRLALYPNEVPVLAIGADLACAVFINIDDATKLLQSRLEPALRSGRVAARDGAEGGVAVRDDREPVAPREAGSLCVENGVGLDVRIKSEAPVAAASEMAEDGGEGGEENGNVADQTLERRAAGGQFPEARSHVWVLM